MKLTASRQQLKLSGIYIGQDKEECYNNNWMKIYYDIVKLFESWKRRKLTVFGKYKKLKKKCIIKALSTSKLV